MAILHGNELPEGFWGTLFSKIGWYIYYHNYNYTVYDIAHLLPMYLHIFAQLPQGVYYINIPIIYSLYIYMR
jgi:hypothetical protein